MADTEIAAAAPAGDVREARTARAWTQAHLAGVAGVDVRTVRRIEGGKGVDPASLAAVSEALGVAPSVSDPAQPVAGEGSPLLRYVASTEWVEGMWACTDVPAWLALRGWDAGRLAGAKADWEAALDAECASGMFSLVGFGGVAMAGIVAFPLAGDFMGERARWFLATGFAGSMLACAMVVWVVMAVRERRRRKAEVRERQGLATMHEAMRLGRRVHVLGPAGTTTFEVVAIGRLRRTFVPVEAMRAVTEDVAPDGRVTVGFTVGGSRVALEHLPGAGALREVVGGWREVVDGFARPGVAA